MNEVERLREEIRDLRERLARLEARKDRMERESYAEFQRAKEEWVRANPMPQPQFINDWATHFPPGTILC